jgi:hypothetical protein
MQFCKLKFAHSEAKGSVGVLVACRHFLHRGNSPPELLAAAQAAVVAVEAFRDALGEEVQRETALAVPTPFAADPPLNPRNLPVAPVPLETGTIGHLFLAWHQLCTYAGWHAQVPAGPS